jgi:diaminopimelate epimerase
MLDRFEFHKMTGAGNDFILGDNRRGEWNRWPIQRLARGLCRRGLSVGADGLILIENSNRASFRLRIYNSDGSESAMCGNGARCAARFALLKVIAGRRMTIETPAGILDAELLPDNVVRVEMPGKAVPPRRLNINLRGRSVPVLLTDTGVPHLVVLVRDLERIPVVSLGRTLRSSPEAGPDGANVDFVSVTNGEPYPMRTYERGVENETLACGTGATAAAWVLHHLGYAGSSVNLRVRSGRNLEVRIIPKGSGIHPFTLTGEARVVFRGFLSEESLQEALEC